MLLEIDGCIFDEDQVKFSHGYDSLDKVGKEAFVNHIHLDTPTRETESQKIINTWKEEMKKKWPGNIFRIYRQIESKEIIIRFHLVRPSEANYCDSGIEIIEIKT